MEVEYAGCAGVGQLTKLRVDVRECACCETRVMLLYSVFLS